MPLQTTVIGSFPKPAYLEVPDWFNKVGADIGKTTETNTALLQNRSDSEKVKFEADVMRATSEVIQLQADCGISVVTDGEVRRENYIHYLCRFIDGIDFVNLTASSMRNGACTTALPTVRSQVLWRGPLDVVAEWRKAQDVSPVPVKYTLPGPMTIIGTLHNAYYENEKELGSDLANILNVHIRALAEAGCKYIQVDEPLFARRPDEASTWGIKLLDQCFEGVRSGCQKIVHICCGYPEYCDQKGYAKADSMAYFKIAPLLDACCVDAVSLEDAHRHNDLSVLSHFKKTKVIFGAIQIASSIVETQDEVEARLEQALQYIDADNLIVAPDCGLAMLPMPILQQKLVNMCAAAKRCGCKKQRIA